MLGFVQIVSQTLLTTTLAVNEILFAGNDLIDNTSRLCQMAQTLDSIASSLRCLKSWITIDVQTYGILLPVQNMDSLEPGEDDHEGTTSMSDMIGAGDGESHFGSTA